MTATVQTSFFSSLDTVNNASRKARRSNRPALRLFQVDVENFDNVENPGADDPWGQG